MTGIGCHQGSKCLVIHGSDCSKAAGISRFRVGREQAASSAWDGLQPCAAAVCRWLAAAGSGLAGKDLQQGGGTAPRRGQGGMSQRGRWNAAGRVAVGRRDIRTLMR